MKQPKTAAVEMDVEKHVPPKTPNPNEKNNHYASVITMTTHPHPPLSIIVSFLFRSISRRCILRLFMLTLAHHCLCYLRF